jgi:serine/threonine protein kinase
MKHNTCESNRLLAFLNNALSDQAERDLKVHLDGCPTCAAELEKLAAAPFRWNAVRSHLRPCAQPTPSTSSENNGTLPLAIRQVIEMLDPTDDPAYLGRMGGYEVIGVVGSGAMGVVLKAVDHTLDRVVALKVMYPALAACGTARQRFAREAKAAAAILHPNVIAIHGVSTDRELPYLVMPYIAGTSLQQRMDRQGPLALTEALRIGSQIAAGLAAAHTQGVIHRDIKPANVMLDEGVETALITDFGLARTIDDATMTRSGAITGTPEYMSPEQARGDAIDCQSDIFSLGSVLYALCSGRRPFSAKTSFGVLRKITDEEPTPIREINSDVPNWLCVLIETMHAKSPTQRPTSIQARDQLENCLAHVYQPDHIPLPSELTRTASRRLSRSLKKLLTGVLTMLLGILIAILPTAIQPADTAPAPAMKTATTPAHDGNPQSTVFKTLQLDFPRQDQKGTLIVDINRGFIEVTGHAQPNVVIEILTPPGFEEPERSDSQLTKLFAPKYDLETDRKSNSLKLDTYNQDYALNLRIKVPHTTDLSLDTYYDGYLRVKHVAGTIRTRSQNCDIHLLDIAGSATAYSYNGNFKIRFTEVAPTANLDFETYNGSIDLSLPPDFAATAAISSGRGEYRSAFKIDSIEDDERPAAILNKVKQNANEYRFGKINGGGIPLRIESQKGFIDIRQAESQVPATSRPRRAQAY